MRDIGEIHQAYVDTNSALVTGEDTAATESDRLAWQIRRLINDSAYFLLAFAQFEDAVRTRARELVAAHGDWPEEPVLVPEVVKHLAELESRFPL